MTAAEFDNVNAEASAELDALSRVSVWQDEDVIRISIPTVETSGSVMVNILAFLGSAFVAVLMFIGALHGGSFSDIVWAAVSIAVAVISLVFGLGWDLTGVERITVWRDALTVERRVLRLPFRRTFRTSNIPEFAIKEAQWSQWNVGRPDVDEAELGYHRLLAIKIKPQGKIFGFTFAVGATPEECEGIAALISQHTDVPWRIGYGKE